MAEVGYVPARSLAGWLGLSDDASVRCCADGAARRSGGS